MTEMNIQGIYRDRLFSSTGHLIFDSGWQSNLIVLRCRQLLASFMTNTATAKGIQSFKVGRGEESWDASGAPLPDPDDTVLVDPAPFEIVAADLKFDFLTPSDDVTGGPTNRIQITATLGENQPSPAGDPPFPLREFGLFGELDGNPFMIDSIRHPLIEKDGATTLERKVRLIF